MHVDSASKPTGERPYEQCHAAILSPSGIIKPNREANDPPASPPHDGWRYKTYVFVCPNQTVDTNQIACVGLALVCRWHDHGDGCQTCGTTGAPMPDPSSGLGQRTSFHHRTTGRSTCPGWANQSL